MRINERYYVDTVVTAEGQALFEKGVMRRGTMYETSLGGVHSKRYWSCVWDGNVTAEMAYGEIRFSLTKVRGMNASSTYMYELLAIKTIPLVELEMDFARLVECYLKKCMRIYPPEFACAALLVQVSEKRSLRNALFDSSGSHQGREPKNEVLQGFCRRKTKKDCVHDYFKSCCSDGREQLQGWL